MGGDGGGDGGGFGAAVAPITPKWRSSDSRPACIKSHLLTAVCRHCCFGGGGGRLLLVLSTRKCREIGGSPQRGSLVVVWLVGW